MVRRVQNTAIMKLLPLVALELCVTTTLLLGQTAPPQQPTSRVEEILLERSEKQKASRPDETERTAERVEAAFVRAQDIGEMLTASRSGLRLKMSSTAPGWDGLVLGSGFSLGTEYYRPDLTGGEMAFRASAVGTTKSNYLFDTQLTFPRLLRDRMIVDTLARYKAERSIDYYGSGPDSERGARTNYARETSEIDIKMELRPARHAEFGVVGSSLWYNVGPGTRPGVASTEQRFRESSAPGVQDQTNFWRGGAYARFDSRTRPYLSGRGTQFQVRFDRYDDRERGLYSFGVLQLDARHAFAFLNEKRVLALRANTALSYSGSDNIVPFYLQQTLGGPNDLRGFRLFRFTDNNSLLLNSEYRWEVAPPLEFAIFADAGKVFTRRAQLNFADLEASAGFGVRIKTRSAVALRLDTAFSHEGFQLWFRFSDIF